MERVKPGDAATAEVAVEVRDAPATEGAGSQTSVTAVAGNVLSTGVSATAAAVAGGFVDKRSCCTSCCVKITRTKCCRVLTQVFGGLAIAAGIAAVFFGFRAGSQSRLYWAGGGGLVIFGFTLILYARAATGEIEEVRALKRQIQHALLQLAEENDEYGQHNDQHAKLNAEHAKNNANLNTTIATLKKAIAAARARSAKQEEALRVALAEREDQNGKLRQSVKELGGTNASLRRSVAELAGLSKAAQGELQAAGAHARSEVTAATTALHREVQELSHVRGRLSTVAGLTARKEELERQLAAERIKSARLAAELTSVRLGLPQ